MDWKGRSAALYGRFGSGARARLSRQLKAAGGAVARDLTSRSDALVVGALAAPLVDPGHLGVRLASACARSIPVFSERALSDMLRGIAPEPHTLPLAPLERQAGLSHENVQVLAAFDIVAIQDGCCRFADGQTLKAAGEILAAGRSLGDCVRILCRARDLAPKGRRKIVLDAHGAAMLEWEQGRTTLEGQGLLPYDEDNAGVDDLFEAAVVAEADGELAAAARLYDQIARIDRKDPIALYNLGNVHFAAKAFDQAIIAYRRAVSRDPGFVEAQYNLGLAYEAVRQFDRARAALLDVLDRDSGHADALFNLAQIEMSRGDLVAAKARFETYLSGHPPEDWAEKARRAILYCNAKLSA